MFTARGLFSSIPCPHQQSCILPRCIFQHPDARRTSDELGGVTETPTSRSLSRDGPRKKRKMVNGDSEALPRPLPTTIGSTTSPNLKEIGTNTERKTSAATRRISPPPIRKPCPKSPENLNSLTNLKTNPSLAPPSTTSQKHSQSLSTPSDAMPSTPLLKQESLNPRIKIPAPASHDMRFKLLRALHEQFLRLNSELSRDATNAEEALVMLDQALITKALDVEEELAATPAIYSNLMKNRILVYKRMSVKQWIEERTRERTKLITRGKLVGTDSVSSAHSQGLSVTVNTDLETADERSLLKELYTPVIGLAKHNYVTSMPTDTEIESAKNGVEAAKGWEICDRCKIRFQVFPGRREEDGALTSGGKCTYHFGKPYWPERSAIDPKAKREKRYRCCDENIGESPGCTEGDCHVFKITEVKRLAAILSFETTPENAAKDSNDPVCIDGEMGYTIFGLELIRLTATSWPDKRALFDVLVRPLGPVLDLNSRYSGVWPKDMAEAPSWSSSSTSVTDKLCIVDSPMAARTLLFSHLSPHTPLIGHGLENDLNALRLIHPTLIDTALLFPHKAGLPFRNGLKTLMQTHLNRQIQVVVDGKMEGHDSKEDANAAGELVYFALAQKWKAMRRAGWTIADGVFSPPIGKPSLSPIGRRRPLLETPIDDIPKGADMVQGEIFESPIQTKTCGTPPSANSPTSMMLRDLGELKNEKKRSRDEIAFTVEA